MIFIRGLMEMPTKTYRKLIKFGKSGFVITVPIGWVRYYGLKAGDKLEMVVNGELLICLKRGGRDINEINALFQNNKR